MPSDPELLGSRGPTQHAACGLYLGCSSGETGQIHSFIPQHEGDHRIHMITYVCLSDCWCLVSVWTFLRVLQRTTSVTEIILNREQSIVSLFKFHFLFMNSSIIFKKCTYWLFLCIWFGNTFLIQIIYWCINISFVKFFL